MKEEFYFLSNDKKTKIRCVKYTPIKEAIAVCQIMHGMREYIDRYEDFATFLSENGIVVYGMDLLGHGKSVLNENNRGYFAKENPLQTVLKDIDHLKNVARGENENLPFFMLGHSMGSFLLRSYLVDDEIKTADIDGAIIVGTGFTPQKKAKNGLKVISIFKKIFGDHHRSRLVEKLMFSKNYKKFDMTGKDLKNSWLTKDENIVKAYYENPLCNYRFTLNGYELLITAVLTACNLKNIEKMRKDLPLLLISGSCDPVGDMGDGVKHLHKIYNKNNLQSKCVIYDDYRHEILNEIGKEVVYKDVLNFIKERIKL